MTTPTPPKKDRAAIWWRLAPLLLLLLLVVAWLVLRPGTERPPEPETAPAAEPITPPEPQAGAAGGAEDETAYTPAERRWIEVAGTPPLWPADFDSAGSCGEAVRNLRALCERLDRKPAVRELKLPNGTFGLLLEVSEALGANLPRAEGELVDLLDARQNVAHVFRTLGEKRTLQLLSIGAAHPEFAEPMALAIYRWLRAAETCGGDDPRPLRPREQYQYAAFLLNTIGGQGYLRRRAPVQEALASFYALLIAERAVREHRDPFGLRLAPEIDRCARLIENQPSLVFRDRYLEKLQRIRPR